MFAWGTISYSPLDPIPFIMILNSSTGNCGYREALGACHVRAMDDDSNVQATKAYIHLYSHHSIHHDHTSEPHCPLHHGLCGQESADEVFTLGNNLPYASLAFSNGNFSTMQLTFSISVN